MRCESFSFGSICIHRTTYAYDVVIDSGRIRKHKKKPSKRFRDTFGHAPLSITGFSSPKPTTRNPQSSLCAPAGPASPVVATVADRQAELLGTIAGQSLPAGDNPLAPLHPRAFAILARGSVSAISQAFSDLLVQAGWKARPAAVSHRSRAIGHSGRRKINALSFHSLRRTATTPATTASCPKDGA